MIKLALADKWSKLIYILFKEKKNLFDKISAKMWFLIDDKFVDKQHKIVINFFEWIQFCYEEFNFNHELSFQTWNS